MLLAALRKMFTAPVAPPARKPLRKRPSLRVEAMEDRVVPATLFVDDDGAQKPGAYTTINAALSVATPNDTIKIYAGTYSETLDVTLNGLRLEGVGNAVIQSPASVTPVSIGADNIGEAVIDIRGARNVMVRDLTVNGSTNTDGNLFSGIRVIQNGSATIRNNTITGLTTSSDANFGWGVQVGTHRGGGSKGTAKVTDNTITNTRKGGVIVDGANSSATVKSNTITGSGLAANVAQYGVQVSRTASARVEMNTLSNFSFNSTATTAAAVLLFQVNDRDNLVARNTISNSQTGVSLLEANRVDIVNNDIVNSGNGGGILLDLSNCNEIVNNCVNGSASDGIGLFESSNNLIKNNSVTNAALSGIYLDVASNCNTIKHNDAFDNGENGIQLVDSSSNNLWNNNTWSNGVNGILIQGGGGNDIWAQESYCNIEDGIRLEDTTCNTIVGSALQTNGGYGLSLYNADNTLIAFNLITGNSSGSVFIDAASENVTTICNRTDEAIEREAIGSAAVTTTYSTSTATSDAETAELADE